MSDTITLHGQPFTREAFEAFRRAYEATRAAGRDEFTFDGQTVLTSYARYVVEYAEREFAVLDGTAEPVKPLAEAIADYRKAEAASKEATAHMWEVLEKYGLTTPEEEGE